MIPNEIDLKIIVGGNRTTTTTASARGKEPSVGGSGVLLVIAIALPVTACVPFQYVVIETWW